MSEINFCVSKILQNYGVSSVTTEILGNSEKGDGYLGDVVFVNAYGENQQYQLVLKCSKSNQDLRKKSQVRYTYLNEIFIYDVVLPEFKNFQKERAIEDPFDNVPNYYGSLVNDNMEVIALENLKSIGYELWPKKEPLTRKSIDLVIEAYGKLHGTSVAMKILEPERFEKLTKTLKENTQLFSLASSGLVDVMKSYISEVYELFLGEIDDATITKWKNYGDDLHSAYDQFRNYQGLKVIIHGDCWNNNHMFRFNKNFRKKVVMLDWQMARYSLPVWDLSYFLFSCLAEDDFQFLDEILSHYHTSFVQHLKKFGVENADKIYSFDHLKEDWKNYGRCAVMLTTLALKLSAAEKDEVVDIEKGAESGKSFSESFMHEVKDKEYLKKRMKPIILYTVEQGLI